MLTNPTLDLMQALGLAGIAAAWRQLAEQKNANELSRDEWLGLMLDREIALRADKRVRIQLASAKLRFPEASIEDIDLDRRNTMALAQGEWLKAHENLIVTGQTGTGKSWLACAFGRQAARLNHSVLYLRVPRFFEDLALARLDGRYPASSTSSHACSSSSATTSEPTPSPTSSVSICSKSLRNAIDANPP